MKNRSKIDVEKKTERSSVSKSRMKNKNMQRLGGGGLSLSAFANSKSTTNQYNPALLKKHREFYKNAKYVNKFKRSLKQLSQPNNNPSAVNPIEDESETGNGSDWHSTSKKNNGENESGSSRNAHKTYKKRNGLKEVYEKKRDEVEKERMEKEAVIQAKKRDREAAEARRKETKEKMLKKTRFGQPVMKYRIEHLLQSIQNPTKGNET